jgi:hypothetical protein
MKFSYLKDPNPKHEYRNPKSAFGGNNPNSNDPNRLRAKMKLNADMFLSF